MTRGAAIEVEGLTKRYGGETAVSDLDLSIPRGTVYGFLGPNGAGKTTTIRMLVTLLRPSAGTAHIDGQPITDREAVTPRLGYLPEEPPLFDELTGREQLAYVAGLRDLPEARSGERIDSLLDRFSLTGDADRRISGYSKGMKRKVGLVQAILHEPEVIFLDEPTSGLDPRAARTVREVVSDLVADGSTVFLSTHVLPVVDELADTVGVLSDGRLVAEGNPRDLKRPGATGKGRSLEDVFLDVTSDGEGLVTGPDEGGR